MSKYFNLPGISVNNAILAQSYLSGNIVTDVNYSDFKLSAESYMDMLSDEIKNKTIQLDDAILSSSENGVKNKVIYDAFKALGITVNPEHPINIDIKNFVNLKTADSWLYMCKIDVNVYLSAYPENYGDALAIPIKGMRFLNASNWDNLDSEKQLVNTCSGFIGEYTCFDENCNEVTRKAKDLPGGEGLKYLHDTRTTDNPNRMYKWCAVYRCDRELNCDDMLSGLNIKYMAQSNRNSKVINTLSSSLSTMDFCFSDEPFVINKDYDYFFVLHNKYVENLSSMHIFQSEAMSSVTYFRCSQFELKDPGATGTGNKVNHGNAWIGWNSVASLSSGLSSHDMNWVWHLQTTNGKQEHAHGYVGPMNLVMDKDAYTLLYETVITKKIADSIYANKSYFSYDGKVERIGQLKIHEYSSDETYGQLVQTQNKNELYIIDQPDGISMYDNVVKNVAEPEDESDAATKGYIDNRENKIMEKIAQTVESIEIGDDADVNALRTAFQTLVTNLKNI